MRRKLLRYFSRAERLLWGLSVVFIVGSFCAFDRENYLTLAASLIGVTSLIFNAKGNPIGQVLMVLFSLLYGIISYTFAYYGEMLTYLGMSLPMAVWSAVTWRRNTAHEAGSAVAIPRLTGRDLALLVLATAAATALFGWLLAALDTPNLGFSILSVATSFLAAALTMLRSSYYGLGYAANDIVLVVLWVLASCEDPVYIPVAVNFGIFLFHDFYGFLSWKKRERHMAQTA